MYKTFEELVAALCDGDKNISQSREIVTVQALSNYYESEYVTQKN